MSQRLINVELYGVDTFDEMKEIIERHDKGSCAITVRKAISTGTVNIPAWTTFNFPVIVLNSGIWAVGFQLNTYEAYLFIRDGNGNYKTVAL